MSTYPPDGWSLTSGTWGTDADQDATTSLTGANSVKFLNTTPASDPFMKTDPIPVQTGIPYILRTNIMSDSTSSADKVFYGIYWLARDESFISSTTCHSTALTATSTWFELSSIQQAPANAAFCQLWVKKNKSAFNAWYDLVSIKEHPACFSAYLSASQTVGAATALVFDTENYDYGSNYNVSDGKFTAPRTGIFSFSCTIRGNDTGAGLSMHDIIYVNGSATNFYSNKITEDFGYISVHCLALLLNKGDYVQIYGYNHGVNGDVYTGSTFSGLQVF